MIRIGFWGPMYYNHNKEPPKQYWQLFRLLKYPLTEEHTLSYRGFHSMAKVYSLMKGHWALWEDPIESRRPSAEGIPGLMVKHLGV